MKRALPVEGQKFGRFTVLEVRSQSKHGAYYHLCLCECGVKKLVSSSNLELGKTKSCGCLAKELTGNRARSHGMSKTPEYQTWSRMWSRCTNPIVDRYPQYGGRGIKVCEEWSSFEVFYADMGRKHTTRHSIGRIDNDKGYCKDNCRWETTAQQSVNTTRNVFIDVQGKRQTVSQWADEKGICQSKLRHRIKNGISGNALFSQKSLVAIPIEVDGVTKLTTEWMRDASIPISSFYLHIRKGMTKEDIIRKYLNKKSEAGIAKATP